MAVRKSFEDEANKVLWDVWVRIAGGPPPVVPVDPVRIAKALGLDVLEADLPPTVSGALRKQRGADPTILLNRHDSPNRQRFTCAHELGHYVLRAGDPVEYDYVDYRDEHASTGTREEERFANGFAACLLMPRDDVEDEYRSTSSATVTAFRFGVSQEAMVNRLENLGLKV